MAQYYEWFTTFRILYYCQSLLLILLLILLIIIQGFPGSSDGKASAYNVGDLGSISGSGRYPGEGNGNPLHYSCLENPMDGGAWWATVHGVGKSDTTNNWASTMPSRFIHVVTNDRISSFYGWIAFHFICIYIYITFCLSTHLQWTIPCLDYCK